MFYYLLTAVALRWLLLDYYISIKYIIPYLNRWNNIAWQKLLHCPYCNGCQVGYLIYLLLLFDWSLLGHSWLGYIKECISLFLFGQVVGYISLFSKVLLDKRLSEWETHNAKR